mmetsp:Transcript_9871/g.28916  ORF Transcript_9871/g.28916 Transcript_9871/m.28916 type:complete len:273 (-) Transcript_9871:185-1003(-)
MPSLRPKVLVVGGTGLLGARCCRRAAARGFDVTSASRSGGPPEGAASGWADRVHWLAVSAREIPDALLDNCAGVISTAGVMVDASFPSAARAAYQSAKPYMHPDSTRSAAHTYQEINCDLHLALAERLAALSPDAGFVYLSAAPPNVLNRWLPLLRDYFKTKAAAEEALLSCGAGLRTVVLRPTVMYDDVHGHTLLPAALSRLSSLCDSALERAGVERGTVPHLIPGPPIFVDTVAECAVEAAVNPAVSGALGSEEITALAESSALSSAPEV